MKPLSSIRRILLFSLLAPILSLWLIGAVITYGLAINFAIDAWDNSLLDSARSVSGRLRFKDSQPELDLSPSELVFLRDNEKDKIYYQVRRSNGQVIAGDTSIPAPDPADKDLPDWRDDTINGETVRIAWIRKPIPNSPGDYVVIQIADTLNGRNELVLEILLGVVLPQLLLIVLAAAAVWIGVTRGLKPLQSVADAVAKRSPTDLSPLQAENAPMEVRPLVSAINGLMDRLRRDLETQKRFVANAAHQLRTPIAGLKTQAELGLRADPQDVKENLLRIKTSADRATRLVHQLLTLARVGPVLASTTYQAVDLTKVAREATEELVAKAIQKDIDLGYEGPSHPRYVLGDAGSLHELASNLIDNAVTYTQPRGKVTVHISHEGPLRLIVEDNGPGIPPEERTKVFERFYRVLANQADGSGLGLAIVRDIAEAHDASVNLSDGPDGTGTSMEVLFPELAPPAANKPEPQAATTA